jgi:hypothetical protein
MVAVLGWPGTTALEARLHLTLSTSSGNTLAALLAGEAPHRIPVPHVPGIDDGADNYQDYEEQAGQRDSSNDAVEQTAHYSDAGRRCDPAPFAFGIRDRMAEANNHTVTAVNAKRRPWRANRCTSVSAFARPPIIVSSTKLLPCRAKESYSRSEASLAGAAQV